VIDEMSKRFLVNGKEELRGLERQIRELESDFETSQREVLNWMQQDVVDPARASEVTKRLQKRHEKIRKLEKAIRTFRRNVDDKNQPAKKLHDATVSVVRRRSVDALMADLTIMESVPAIARDRRVTMGGRIAQLQAQCITLSDGLIIAKAMKTLSTDASIKMPGDSPDRLAKSFFQSCGAFIGECITESLPKLSVEATLYYARVVRAYEPYCHTTKKSIQQASGYVETAKELLGNAEELCSQPFENADGLHRAVDEANKLLGKAWYEAVTTEELAAIKNAMVGGPTGIATHSGHWYNCANGHPVSSLLPSLSCRTLIEWKFAIGECGMPMQQARCPECGAPVGGQNHQAVEGVTRAENMES
jgi:hypothetical protein